MRIENNRQLLNPYGYPCGAHTHATPTARAYCQGPPVYDEIKDLGLKGFIYTKRKDDE